MKKRCKQFSKILKKFKKQLTCQQKILYTVVCKKESIMKKNRMLFKNWIFSIKKCFENYMNGKLKEFDVTAGQTQFLHILYKENSLKQSALSKFAECDKSYTHRMVKELLDKKLVQISQGDFVSLTEKGAMIGKEFDKQATKWHKLLFEDIAEKDIAIVKKVFENITQKAQKIINNMEKK